MSTPFRRVAEPADIMVRRILCAVRPAPSSRPVIDCAAWLATLFDAEVRLFHAADATPDADGDRLVDLLFAQTREVPGRVRFSAAVTTGHPPLEISRHARLIGADLLMVAIESAAPPRTGAALGRIAAGSGRPVLAIAGDGAGRGAVPPIQSLVYEDGRDDTARAAAAYARILARKTAAIAVPVPAGAPCADAGSSRADRVLVVGVETSDGTGRLLERHAATLADAGGCSVLMVPWRAQGDSL